MLCRCLKAVKGPRMVTRPPQSLASGYSLIELLVVLAIVAILSIAGVTMLGNRGGNSVRVVLDELEGGIMDAHKFAASSGREVALVTWGTWDVTTTNISMVMARGSANQTAAAIQGVANNLMASPPVLPTTDPAKTVAVVFSPSRSREYMNAGVVVEDTDWWTKVMLANGDGKKNQDITTVEPFKSDAAFLSAISGPNNLFKNAINQVTISGANKRFNSTFFVQVVGTSNGFAVPGGAMGLIVVQNNGATVYKFYNPGVNNGDGLWRRM